MSEYVVQPVSRKELRDYALQIRQNIGFEDKVYFPVVEFWEILPDLFKEYSFEIVDDDSLDENVHGFTDIVNKRVCIKNSIYEGACAGSGRDRMTVAHELSHFFTLVVSGFKIARNFFDKKVKAYEDPEWQAKCMAGELLVPYHLVKGLSAEEIANLCGVSLDAAIEQIKHF